MPSNSLRFNDLASLTLRSSIGATFVRLPVFRFSVNLSFSTGAITLQDYAFLSALSKRLRRLAKDDHLTVGHALKLVKNNRRSMRQSRKRLSGTCIPWSRNGMFSEGFPTEASAYRPKPFEPLPFILFRQALWATGKLICSSATFQEYQAILGLSTRLLACAFCRLATS